MLHDLFWPNVAVFGIGQLAAWFHLRTGRVVRGVVTMVALLLLADLALVARFAYGAEGVAVGALGAMQVWALGEAVLLGIARWRRARPAAVARRRHDYRLAIVSELRGEDAEALALLRGLARVDPWDVEVAFALAAVHRRLGDPRASRRQLRRARRLDRIGRLSDLIYLEELRLRAPRAAGDTPRVARAVPAPVPASTA